MEQYIEREKFIKKSAECFGHFGVLVKAIEEIADECTTADVVPKSEVEKLIIDRNAARLGMIAEHERLKMAKTEVARDIFAEIDGITDLFAKGLIGELEMYDKLAELKKKYRRNRHETE